MKKTASILFAVMLILSVLCMPVAALNGSASKTSTSYMSIGLNPQQSGTSNTLSFDFSALPANAVVQKVTVKTGTMTVGGGAISTTSINVKGSNMPSWASEAWRNVSSGTIFTTSVSGYSAKGTWLLSFDGYNAGATYGTKKYDRPEMIIEYTY